MHRPLTKKLSRAIPLMLLAGLCLAIQGGLVKYTSTSLTVEAIFFGRTLFALMITVLYVLPHFKEVIHEKIPNVRHKYIFLFRGFFGGIAGFLFYYSVTILPVSTATMLYLTFPVFVPIISRIWLKTPIVPYIWWGLSLAFIGIAFILQPMKISLDWRIFLGLSTGILGAFASLINRVLHRYQSQKKIVLTYFGSAFAVSVLCIAIRALGSTVVFHPVDWLFLLTMGVTAFLFQYCFSLALRYAPARLVTPCTYFSLIFTVAIDRIYWGIHPSLWEFLGIGGVVLGVIIIMCVEPQEPYLSK